MLKEPISGQSSDQVVTAQDCAQLELAVYATGLNKTVDCSVQISSAPTILSSPVVGAPLLNNTSTSKYSFIENPKHIIFMDTYYDYYVHLLLP